MPDDRELTEALLEVVRELLEQQQLSVKGVAGRIGVNHQTLSRHLRGEGNLTIDEWDRLAVALGEDLDSLVAAGRRRM